MYRFEDVEVLLTISRRTLNRWMAETGIKSMRLGSAGLGPQGNWAYISDKDMRTLLERYTRLTPHHLGDINILREKAEKAKRDGEEELYTIVEVARFLNVAENTARRLVSNSGIEKKKVGKRVCISLEGLQKLVVRHKRVRAKTEKDEKNEDGDAEILRMGQGSDFLQNTGAEEELRKNSFYTLTKAAEYLGVSRDAVRKWVKKYGIETKLIRTDRERVYIAQSELEKIKELRAEKRVLNEIVSDSGERVYFDRKERENIEKLLAKKVVVNEMVTLKYAAEFLGVAESTLRRWMEKANVSMVAVEKDRKRVYVYTKDLIKILDEQCEKKVKEDWLTMKEAIQFLDVSRRALRKWMEKEGVNKKVVDTDRKRVYIHHSDVMKFAEQHPKRGGMEPRM